MNLAEFVETALTEVLKGVRKAQAKEGGENVAAAYQKQTTKDCLFTTKI